MRLMIDPPVSAFSTVEGIREWLRELAAMREEYRDNPDALGCVASEEEDARRLMN